MAGFLTTLATPGEAAVELRAELEDEHYVSGQEINLRLMLENDGDEPVQVPDPYDRKSWQPGYHITGPQFPDGRTFSARSGSVAEHGPPQPGEAPPQITLAPGQSETYEIPIGDWVTLTEPGRYTLSVRYEHGAGVAEAGPFELSVTRPELVSAAVMTEGPDNGGASPLFEWIDAGTGQLFEGAFETPDPMVEYAGRVPRSWPFSNMPVRSVDADARLIPIETNTDPYTLDLRWRAWQLGPTLHAEATMAPEPAVVAPDETVDVVRPALLASDATLAVFVVMPADDAADAPGDLGLVRFRAYGKLGQDGAEADLLWRRPLPAEPVVTAATLGSAAGGSESRQVVIVAESREGLAVHALAVDGDGTPGEWVAAEAVGWSPLPGSVAGAAVVPDDGLRVAFLAADDDRLALLEFVPGSEIVPTPLLDMPGPPATSAVARTNQSWTWVVELESGEFVSRGKIDPWTPARPPVHPLQVVTSQGLAYLLTADPARGPKLDELPAGIN